MVKKTPEIFEDIGKNAREWVSLRILESFYDQGIRANSVFSTPTKRKGFDPSEQCEDVLRRMLPEVLVYRSIKFFKKIYFSKLPYQLVLAVLIIPELLTDFYVRFKNSWIRDVEMGLSALYRT